MEHRGVGGVAAAVEPLETELVVVGRALLELALEVAQGEVGEVVGALVGAHEVGRQRGVADQPVERPVACRQREHRALGVVEHLGPPGVAQPGHQRGVVLGGDLDGIDPGGLTVGRSERDPADLAGAGAPGALDGDPGAGLRAGVGVEPAAHLAGGQPHALELEARVVDERGVLHVPRLEEPVAQHPELQRVEERVDQVAVPRLGLEVGRRDFEVEVADQGVEPPVADHVAEVVAQGLALLAGDLVGMGDHVVETVVLVDPAGGEARPDAGHTGKVVGGLADDRRELGVAVGRHAVLRLDRLRGHPGQLGDAAHRVEHRRVLGHELERVAVAGEDQHLHALGQGLGDERGDDVVGLVALQREVPDPQRVEHLVDQRELAGELVGGLVALRLVLGVLREAEGLP